MALRCDKLRYCLSESLKKKVFDSGTNSVSEILEGIKKVCVKAHNNLVNVNDISGDTAARRGVYTAVCCLPK